MTGKWKKTGLRIFVRATDVFCCRIFLCVLGQGTYTICEVVAIRRTVGKCEDTQCMFEHKTPKAVIQFLKWAFHAMSPTTAATKLRNLELLEGAS